jgi:hypothetical protein
MQPFAMAARCDLKLGKGLAAVGSIDVGDKIPARQPGRLIAERLPPTDDRLHRRIESSNPLRIKRPGNCGAMSQQRGDSGNYSTPQKFVQLVGCRDPKASSGPWVRPDPAKP